MWSIIKRMLSSCCYYAKELFITLWYGFTFEGEAATKALTVGYQGWRRHDLNGAVREAVSDVLDYAKEHPARSAAIGGVVLARYTSPLGFVSTTKMITERISSVIQNTADVSFAVQFKSIYERTLKGLDAAFHNKYIKEVPLSESAWNSDIRFKIIMWADKAKNRLKSAWKDEKYLMDWVLSQCPQTWVDCFNKLAEHKNIDFKSCIAAFELLEKSPSNTMLTHALTEFQKLKGSISKLMEMMIETISEIDLVKDRASQVAQLASTNQVFPALEHIANNFPSNKQAVGVGFFTSSVKRLYTNFAANPNGPLADAAEQEARQPLANMQ